MPAAAAASTGFGKTVPHDSSAAVLCLLTRCRGESQTVATPPLPCCPFSAVPVGSAGGPRPTSPHVWELSWVLSRKRCLEHPSHMGAGPRVSPERIRKQGCGFLRPEPRLCPVGQAVRGAAAREGLGIPPPPPPHLHLHLPTPHPPAKHPDALALRPHIQSCSKSFSSTSESIWEPSPRPHSRHSGPASASWSPCLHSGPCPRFSFHSCQRVVFLYCGKIYIT